MYYMYINEEEVEEERYSVEDVIVPYSNVKITHVNDNKPPLMLVFKRTVLWVLIASMLAGLFFF